MEDLAHFIQSMSEKYGLLDGIDNKEQPGELNGLATGKQIKEPPSSAASNSHANNNEVSSGQQASNWEYLSLFVTGETVDTKKASSVAFQSEGDSHLHAYARMIDINKSPEPESPLPTTSQVVVQESEDGDESFLEVDSVPVGCGEIGKVEKSFSKEYVQNVYVLKESGGKHQQTNCESLDESSQLREVISRQNSLRSLQSSRRTNEQCCPMELDQDSQIRVSSSRSDHLDDQTDPSAVENREVQQHRAECSTTTTAGDANYEENQTRRPISTGSLSANAGWGQAHSQARPHRGVVSSFVVLDNEADFGENVALHEYAISSGGSSSKSYRTEGPDTGQDVRKSQDGRSGTLMDEYCSNLHCDDQLEEEAERRSRHLSKGHRQAQHTRSRSLDEPEKGIDSSYGEYYAGEEENPLVNDQTQEGESASGFEFIGTDVSGGFDLGKIAATFGKPIKEEHQRITIRGSELGIQPKKGNYKQGEFHQELTQELQETETTKPSFNERNRDPLEAHQQSLKNSKMAKKEKEQRDHAGDWDDLDEEDISLSGRQRNNQNLLVDRGPGKQQTEASSARVQGLPTDSYHVLEEGEGTSNEGGYSSFRTNSFGYRCNKSGNEKEEHAGNQDKLESFDHRERKNENGRPSEGTRKKHRAKHYVLDSPENYSHVGDLLTSIDALANIEMRDRSSFLDKATNKLIAEVEASNEPSMKSKSSSDSARMVEKMLPHESSRLEKHGLESQRQQSAGLTSDLSGPCTIDEARNFESWDLDEEFNLHPGRPLWESENIKSKWIYVNSILCDNGFSRLNSSCLNPTVESIDELFDALEDVVRNYSRREKLVQELLAERDSLRQEEERNDQVTVKLETQVESLKEKLAASEQRAELAAAAAGKNIAAQRKEHQRLEATHASLLQRCSQLEHVCRAKERSIGKLQEKIQDAVTREHSQRTRDKELYDKLKQKVAISQKAQGEIIESNFLLRDLKPVAIVGIYERQRAASEAEMNQLREENARLCKELREKENTLLSKAMSAVDADQAELDQREQDLIQQLTEVLEIQQVGNDCLRRPNIGFTSESNPCVNRGLCNLRHHYNYRDQPLFQ
ncbi:hypothetical protein R1sor_022383 [Riccia sorocarpa]|uniref:Centrosomal protein of 70 kDa n=1 Tax=Riccia sorocarpa TaxID=122646 RepID=A0ABD3GJP0_9MARC